MHVRISAVIILTVSTMANGAGQLSEDASTTPVRVALFADAGCTDGKSREAVYKVLSDQPGITVDKVTTETVRSPGFMVEYDVFLLPGGTGSGEANAVGVDAGKRIAASIESGKGLVAICAGGYYVAKGGSEAGRALDIINAENHDGEHWARGEAMIGVKVVGASDVNSSRIMWYENGPIFKPADNPKLQPYVPLVRYVTDMAAEGAPGGQMAGRDAIIAANYGSGRVVAFGPHPELSPRLNYWLVNAVKWAAGRRAGDSAIPDAHAVLGESEGPQ